MEVSKSIKDTYMSRVILFLRDDPAVNKLISGKQFSPGQIEFAIDVAFDRVDKTPPGVRIASDSYPIYIMLKAISLQLFETAQIVDMRNDLPYQDSGLTVKDTHEQHYTQLINYHGKFVQDLISFKQTINVENSMTPMQGV